MSAVKFSDSENWVVPKWVFSYLAEKILDRVGQESPLRALFHRATKEGLDFVTIDQLETADQKRFGILVRKIYQDLLLSDASQFSTPEGSTH